MNDYRMIMNDYRMHKMFLSLLCANECVYLVQCDCVVLTILKLKQCELSRKIVLLIGYTFVIISAKRSTSLLS
jgi:hypothetical protein